MHRIPMSQVDALVAFDEDDELFDAMDAPFGHVAARFVAKYCRSDMRRLTIYFSKEPCKTCLKMLSGKGVERLVIMGDPPKVLKHKK